MENQTPTPAQRRTRVSRNRIAEFQKIEIATHVEDDIMIDTKILNKLQRKAQRRK